MRCGGCGRGMEVEEALRGRPYKNANPSRWRSIHTRPFTSPQIIRTLAPHRAIIYLAHQGDLLNGSRPLTAMQPE